jgi:putative permease
MNVLNIIGGWLNRYFSQEDAVYLVVALSLVLVLLYTLGGALAPVLTGLVIAFLLEGMVSRLQSLRMPRIVAVNISVLLFVSTVMAVVFLVVPLLWQQLQSLGRLVPTLVTRLQEGLINLAERFPEYVTEAQVAAIVEQGARELGNVSGTILESAFSQVFSVFGLLIYLVLVPISVFFLLKDKDALMLWAVSILPKKRPLLDSVGKEMNAQLGNYVRGKVLEILIVGAVTFLTFVLFGLNYAALLAVIVGVSVLIPFVGAAIVTLPVFAVAVLQFGWSLDLGWIMLAYLFIQFLDGNVLVPLLFSEAVDLHPITIIIAVLAFGGIGGIWGVFFAIPLATLIKAIYSAWPNLDEAQKPESVEPSG